MLREAQDKSRRSAEKGGGNKPAKKPGSDRNNNREDGRLYEETVLQTGQTKPALIPLLKSLMKDKHKLCFSLI